MTQNKEILVDKDEEPIRLDQLLKFHGIAASGGAAKHMIQGGNVKVNGEVETRRGRKLRTGDRIEALGQELIVE
ncbi:MAG: RNA-binding S4 domain-containing protein [Cyanobacteria bacterium HKST-UBA02]|nr:RNA-binding S4 domain-containing protein [Cyanobacteria bacterium HKST-UBA02]